MSNERFSIERILSKLDEYLNKNDYSNAERHLKYWLAEAEQSGDQRAELLIMNELMGLMRKLERRNEALDCVDKAINKIEMLGIGEQIGAATTFLNSATVCKALGMAERSIPLFEKAREIYESKLDSTDGRLGGLYNNMALSLSDLNRFSEAKELFNKAIEIMNSNGSLLEVAITLLNLATMVENELGLENACEIIEEYLEKARGILENWDNKNGYYAFVCDKCASVYGYYGHFAYENELNERVRRIYEGS